MNKKGKLVIGGLAVIIVIFAGIIILPPLGWVGWIKLFLMTLLCFVVGAGCFVALIYGRTQTPKKTMRKRYQIFVGITGLLLVITGCSLADDISKDIRYLKQPVTEEKEVYQIRADHGYRSTSYYLDVSSGEQYRLGHGWHRYFGKTKPLFSLKSGQKVKLTYLPHSEVILAYQIIPEKKKQYDQALIKAEQEIRPEVIHFSARFNELAKDYGADKETFLKQVAAMLKEKEAISIQLDQTDAWQKSDTTRAYAASAKKALEMECASLQDMLDHFDDQSIIEWMSEIGEVQRSILAIDFPMLSYEEVG
ncbi:hypothetical protein [Listeria ilorinensis]|uniref:hypothetical protein n=1 Tax=Listeria ilorinensis TaxID=2867439 RepID=UPI001EF4B72A|nr:hypothetical protein [Listeria ilorinensis]